MPNDCQVSSSCRLHHIYRSLNENFRTPGGTPRQNELYRTNEVMLVNVINILDVCVVLLTLPKNIESERIGSLFEVNAGRADGKLDVYRNEQLVELA